MQTETGKLFKHIFLEDPLSGAYEAKNNEQTNSRTFYDGFMGTLVGDKAHLNFSKGDKVLVDVQLNVRYDVKDGVTRYFNGISIRGIAKLS